MKTVLTTTAVLLLFLCTYALPGKHPYNGYTVEKSKAGNTIYFYFHDSAIDTAESFNGSFDTSSNLLGINYSGKTAFRSFYNIGDSIVVNGYETDGPEYNSLLTLIYLRHGIPYRKKGIWTGAFTSYIDPAKQILYTCSKLWNDDKEMAQEKFYRIVTATNLLTGKAKSRKVFAFTDAQLKDPSQAGDSKEIVAYYRKLAASGGFR